MVIMVDVGVLLKSKEFLDDTNNHRHLKASLLQVNKFVLIYIVIYLILGSQIYPNNIQEFSPQLKDNTILLRYKNQQVNAV
jgi:hypothetical protein